MLHFCRLIWTSIEQSNKVENFQKEIAARTYRSWAHIFIFSTVQMKIIHKWNYSVSRILHLIVRFRRVKRRVSRVKSCSYHTEFKITNYKLFITDSFLRMQKKLPFFFSFTFIRSGSFTFRQEIVFIYRPASIQNMKKVFETYTRFKEHSLILLETFDLLNSILGSLISSRVRKENWL